MAGDGNKWSGFLGKLTENLGELGKDLEQAVRDASESPAGRAVRDAVREATPQVKRAFERVGPEVKKVVDQVRPEVQRVVEQVGPQVKSAMDQLFGGGDAESSSRPERHDTPVDVPRAEASGTGGPPNVSPDAWRSPASSPPKPPTGAGVSQSKGEAEAKGAPKGAKSAPKTVGRAPRSQPRGKPGVGKAKKPLGRKPPKP